jgi:hypothetical protein
MHSRGMICPSLACAGRPKENRGRRECRVMTSPMARLQQKTQAAVTTGSAGSTDIPCAMVLTLLRALPGVHDLVSHRRLPIISANLTPAQGCQDHTTSPSERCRSSARETARSTPHRPSHPASTFGDDWPYAPLQSRRDAENEPHISEKRNTKIFPKSRNFA